MLLRRGFRAGREPSAAAARGGRGPSSWAAALGRAWVGHRLLRPVSAGVRRRKTSLTPSATTECANFALHTRDDLAHSRFAAQVSGIVLPSGRRESHPATLDG